MFGRNRGPSGDVVAAAQRRLAALTQQHDWQAGEAPRPDLRPTSTADDASAPHPIGRHVGERQSEIGRWGITGQQVTIVALGVVALVVLVAWWALRSMPSSHDIAITAADSSPRQGRVSPAAQVSSVATTPSGVLGGSSLPAPPAGGDSSSTQIVVDVAGKVRRPGIVELPPGSRVMDAIEAAGGPRSGVALTSVNLARLLVDGEQIVVGVQIPDIGGGAPSTPTSESASAPSIAPVDINTATAEQLDTLPGIGPVTADAILQWRTENGAFTSVDQLLSVTGIGDATLADIRPYVHV